MGSTRPAEKPFAARRRPAQPGVALPPGPGVSVWDVLLRSWPGRLFIIAAALRLLVSLVRLAGDLPPFFRVLSTAATIGLAVSLIYFALRLIRLLQRRLLWRVRRKLILSYVFIGVIPAFLIIGFFLLGGLTLAMSVSAYVFHDGHLDVVRTADLLGGAAASEIGRTPDRMNETITRIQRNGQSALGYPSLSMAFVPEGGRRGVVRAGPWEHVPPPDSVPDWVRRRPDGFAGTIARPSPEAGEAELVIRSAKPAFSGGRSIGWVVVDIPVDGSMLDRLYELTGVKGVAITVLDPSANPAPIAPLEAPDAARPDQYSIFGRGVSMFDAVDWPSGDLRRVSISLAYSVGELYRRVSMAQSVQLSGMTFGQATLLILLAVAILFVIIQIVALIMGLALARSITSSIHELFMGTERVRQGDFGHRINVTTRDQLGELADSFNQMTGSIENLLQTAAEKKRLEEELRIARQIQMSLLPRGPLDVPGLAVTALCVPAREVGGDYYDLFPLGQDRIGVLIADVSGKGTSAALYMAELKGLVLSLSQIYQSPRQLLLEVNRIISENLDSRSFITMTYAVLDLRQGVMTYARAGHTPLIFVPAASRANGGAQVLAPSGMVLGLRIDGAAEKFDELLEEQQLTLVAGDIIVLYTDGITEAMNASSELFGESRLSRILEEHGHLDSAELRERILREIESFVGGADQHDDMTMILMKVESVAAVKVAV